MGSTWTGVEIGSGGLRMCGMVLVLAALVAVVATGEEVDATERAEPWGVAATGGVDAAGLVAWLAGEPYGLPGGTALCGKGCTSTVLGVPSGEVEEGVVAAAASVCAWFWRRRRAAGEREARWSSLAAPAYWHVRPATVQLTHRGRVSSHCDK